METPEQARKKLRQYLALAVSSLAAAGLAAAVFWPHEEEVGRRSTQLSKTAGAESKPATTRHSARWSGAPQPAGTNTAPSTPTDAPAQDSLDEPAPKITVKIKPDEMHEFEVEQERRRVAFEEDLKTRLTPEQQRARAKGLKIWQERNNHPSE